MNFNFLQNIIELDTIDSTNLYLKANYHRLPNSTTVIAKYQTKGQGQFARVWESDRDKNLMFSILIKDGLVNLNTDVSDIIIKAILMTLKEFGVDARFKFPNDIYFEDKKIAGTLIETKFNEKNLEYIIIGIGMNINQETFMTPKAISLFQIIKNKLDLKHVFQTLLNYISKNFQTLLNINE